MIKSRPIIIAGIVVLTFSAVPLQAESADSPEPVTTADRMEQIGSIARLRLRPWFARENIDYPPKNITLVAIKDTKRLKIYAPDETGTWQFVMQYQIAKLSGEPGPKLREGDDQVPEGVYKITHLNPESKFWLSLALNYPNTFDRRQARRDDRTNLGGEIMLHGWWFSTGCVAMGNTAAEDLFVLAKDVGINNAKVIITPTDFRDDKDHWQPPEKPDWVGDLYANLKDELNTLGSEGLTTQSRLIAYNDLAPPPPPEPKTTFGKILRALVNAAETSGTETTE